MAENDDSEVWPASEANKTIMVKARSHDRLTTIRELFISGHAEDVLPPVLAEYAKHGRAVSRDSWPRWLVLDVALRYCQEGLERDLGVKRAPAAEPESERLLALREALSKTTNKKERTALEKQIRELEAAM